MCNKPDLPEEIEFVCEICGEKFVYDPLKDHDKYEVQGVDAGTIEDWENGMGAPTCLRCLKKGGRNNVEPKGV